jgi:3-hydroxyisobutyrate dehydrogenase
MIRHVPRRGDAMGQFWTGLRVDEPHHNVARAALAPGLHTMIDRHHSADTGGRPLPAVGFVGLGNMGAPLAERLLGQTALTVHDRSPDRANFFVDRGAGSVTSSDAVAHRAEFVLTCLPSSADVRRAIFGVDGEPGIAAGLRSGTMIVDMTTGNPAATQAMAAELAPRGIDLIDAPVSGGPRGAREGTIAIIVGGSQQQFERVAPLLGMISRNVVHAGPVGAGHAVKAGNNLLNLICRLATFEVVSMLVRQGVDPATATGILQKSSGRNYATEITLPDNILSGKMLQGFTNALMQKDSNVALALAAGLGVSMPFGDLARDTLAHIVAEHGAEADISSVALTYETLTGARIRP